MELCRKRLEKTEQIIVLETIQQIILKVKPKSSNKNNIQLYMCVYYLTLFYFIF